MGILHPPCVFDAAETQHLPTAKTKCALTPDLLMTNNLIVKQFCQTLVDGNMISITDLEHPSLCQP